MPERPEPEVFGSTQLTATAKVMKIIPLLEMIPNKMPSNGSILIRILPMAFCPVEELQTELQLLHSYLNENMFFRDKVSLLHLGQILIYQFLQNSFPSTIYDDL